MKTDYMKSGFKDRTEVKDENKVIKSPFNFDCPQYDERSSKFITAGSHYGVGVTQPIGSKEKPKDRVDCLPFGRVDTLKVSERPHRNLKMDIEE